MTLHTGRHFLQIPGPTNVPERVLRAIDAPTIDHRGPEFAALGQEVLVRTINLGEMDHPMHLHGFLMTVIGQDGGAVPEAARYSRYTQNVAPGEAYDMTFTPDEPGTWLLHCHILAHVTGPNGTDAGMITPITVQR